ncbi:MAG: GAF domain-containing sensor histidine kinase [Actinomycetota bacterium]
MTQGHKASLEQEMSLLLELSRDVSSTLDLQAVLDKSLASLRRLIVFDGGSIQLVVDGALQLAATDPPAPPEAYAVRLPLGRGLGGRIAVTCEPLYCPDATADARADPEGLAKAATAGIRSYFGAPLIEHGAAIGLVQLDSGTVDAFPANARAFVLAFLPTITAAVQNARLFNREVETLNLLREAENIKSDFLALVSHELRTPLTVVIGIADTLAGHTAEFDADTIKDLARRIGRNGQVLMRLIEDLLDLSTIERDVMNIEVTSLDAEELIREVADGIHAERPLRIRIAPGLPPVLADADRLTQVLRNLLSNAVKFSPPGTPIEVHAEMEGDRVAVSVTDHGLGIPKEFQEQVFQRFFQVERTTTRSVGGIGIGLYLVQHLCKLMGASVRIDSSPGHGSTFTVVLAAAASGANALLDA